MNMQFIVSINNGITKVWANRNTTLYLKSLQHCLIWYDFFDGEANMILDDDYWSLCYYWPLTFPVMLLLVLLWPAVTHVVALVQ